MHPGNGSPTSRREFVTTSAAALATLWLAADPEDLHASLRHAARAAREPLAWETLTPEEAADVEAIAIQIIPSDETPGAREAHVVNFIDHSLANWASAQRGDFTKGLTALNAEVEQRWPGTGRFARLPAEHQVELLKDWEKEDKENKDRKPFFEAMRSASVTGMFSDPSYGGNTDKLGWKLLGFDDRGMWQPPFGSYDVEANQGER